MRLGSCFRYRSRVKTEATLRLLHMIPRSQHAQSADESMLRWIRPPRQGRTRETLGRILEAAEDLFSRKGFDRVSVVEVVRSAGTSIGGFYRRFSSKDDLLHALHERFCIEAKATAAAVLDPARWQGVSTPAMFQALADFLIDVYRERRGLFRAFLVRAITDSETNRRNQDLFDFLATKMAALLDERRTDLKHPNPELGARFMLRVGLGALNHMIVMPEAVQTTEEKMVRQELARVFRGYLGVRPLQMAARTAS
ncbi:MAG: hypothetical protein KatS3mg077_0510 [Candidatus Binatia bacterium]|nr:MAG: hypothetical protein KatS3mg077_0510 [Candidatus Binatia bacterium]